MRDRPSREQGHPEGRHVDVDAERHDRGEDADQGQVDEHAPASPDPPGQRGQGHEGRGRDEQGADGPRCA